MDRTPSCGEGGSYPELRGCEIRLSPADGFALILRIDYDTLIHRSLSVETPNSEQLGFAYNDDAHPSPWGLRWDELELICQVVSSIDDGFESPTKLVLLLHRFAPLMEGDDLSHISELAEASWTSLGLFSRAEVQRQIDWIDTRAPVSSRAAKRHSDGITDRPTRTFRHNRDPISPGGQAVERYLDQVRQVASTSELDDLAGRAEAEGYEIEGLRPRPTNRYSLNISLNDPDRPLPPPAADLITNMVDTVLASLFLGGCKYMGGEYMTSGRQIMASSWLKLAGDVDHGLSVVSSILRWFGVPESTRFTRRDTTPGAAVETFELGELASDSVASYMVLSQIGVVEIPSLESHRFRPRVISSDVLATVLSAAENNGVVLSESNDQRGFDAICADGGEVSIVCQPPEYDPTGITVTAGVLTAGAADLIHAVASGAGLWIAPMMVAPGDTVAQSITTRWPPRHVVDADGLFGLLRTGRPP